MLTLRFSTKYCFRYFILISQRIFIFLYYQGKSYNFSTMFLLFLSCKTFWSKQLFQLPDILKDVAELIYFMLNISALKHLKLVLFHQKTSNTLQSFNHKLRLENISSMHVMRACLTYKSKTFFQSDNNVTT